MSPHAGDSQEKSPLLLSEPSLAYGVPAAPTKEPRAFKGRWFHMFGDCSPADVSATCLAIHAPAVAYGWNAQRGLGLKWWKEALKLMLLTCGVFALIRITLVVLVETQCPDVAHGRMAGGPHHPEPWMMPRGDGAALAKPTEGQALPMDDPRPRPDGDDPRPRPDDDDDDDEDERRPHPHDHDHPFPRPDDRNSSDPHPRPFPDHDDNHTHPHPRPHGHDDDDDDDDDDHHHHEHGPWGPHHHHHDHHHHHHGWGFEEDDDDMPPLSKEERAALHHCAVRVGPWAVLLASVGISAFVYAAYMAALRRRMMRERFGIEGTFKHDLLLWLGCAPCALAQETRTLMFNHVEEGLWHGPLVAVPPRQVQPMTA